MEFQGLSLGRMLLEFAELAAIKAGYTVIMLYTNEAMTETMDLYHRIGHSEAHTTEEKGLSRVYMAKRLMPPNLSNAPNKKIKY